MPVFKLVAVASSIDMTLDGFSNTFIYTSTGSGAINPATANDLVTVAHGFYNLSAPSQVQPLSYYLSASLNYAAGITWHCYDLTSHVNGTPVGAPIATINKPITTASVGNPAAPEGCCAVLSYHRDYGTDPEFVRDPTTHKVIARPRMQDRGRMYIGPLSGFVFLSDATTKRCRLIGNFIGDCLKAFDFASTVTATDSSVWHLSHWSKKKADTADIVGTWMDDRPDYQRRRSDQSAVKTTGAFSY